MPKILRFPGGTSQAVEFERLVRPHVEYLYRLAHRFTNTSVGAEDLVQDLLLRLYPRTAELRDIEKLRPWLARVLYRQFVDFVRRCRRDPLSNVVESETDDDDALSQFPSPEEGPDAHVDRSLRQEHLLHALGQLSAEHRAVLVLHDVEGYSLGELEQILEAPLGTIKSRLHRARENLRAGLPAMEPFTPDERVKDDGG